MHTFSKLAVLLGLIACAHAADQRILCFGDSTAAPRKGVIPYCDHIRAPGRETINRGVPGNTTAMARARFSTDVLSAKPDVVIIQFGINDSTVDVWKTPPATAPRVSVEEFRDHLTHFVTTLRHAKAKIILMTFNPLAWTTKMREMYGKPPYDPAAADGFNAGRAPYLAVIREIARAHQLTLVDIDAAFRADAAKPTQSIDNLLLDGIHPNTRAHELIAALLQPLLKN